MIQSRIEIRGNNIILHLDDGESIRTKVIGLLERDKLIIRKRLSQLFRKKNSYGFNKEMIENVDYKILLLIFDDGSTIATTKEFLLKYGFYWQEENYEPQIHLKVEQFGLSKALKWEEEQKRIPISKDLYTILAEIKKEEENDIK